MVINGCQWLSMVINGYHWLIIVNNCYQLLWEHWWVKPHENGDYERNIGVQRSRCLWLNSLWVSEHGGNTGTPPEPLAAVFNVEIVDLLGSDNIIWETPIEIHK